MLNPSARTLLGAMLVALSAGAMAQTATATASDPARIDQRQANQEQRIQQGVANGSLTPHEQRRVDRGQKRVAAAEQRAEADGKLSAAEQRKIEKRQDQQSRLIHRRKNDADKPPVARPAG